MAELYRAARLEEAEETRDQTGNPVGIACRRAGRLSWPIGLEDPGAGLTAGRDKTDHPIPGGMGNGATEKDCVGMVRIRLLEAHANKASAHDRHPSASLIAALSRVVNLSPTDLAAERAAFLAARRLPETTERRAF